MSFAYIYLLGLSTMTENNGLASLQLLFCWSKLGRAIRGSISKARSENGCLWANIWSNECITVKRQSMTIKVQPPLFQLATRIDRDAFAFWTCLKNEHFFSSSALELIKTIRCFPATIKQSAPGGKSCACNLV